VIEITAIHEMSEREYREMQDFYEQFKRQLSVITRTFHDLLDHLITYYVAKDTQKTTDYKIKALNLISRLIELTKGERFKIAKKEKSEGEEIALLRKMLPKTLERLHAEQQEDEIYHNMVRLANEKAKLLAKLYDLINTLSPGNLEEIKKTRNQFEQYCNQLAEQIRRIVEYEERMKKAA
jgi:hypothetical protein